MCVCVFELSCKRACVRVCVRACIYASVRAYVCMGACVCSCVYADIPMCVGACVGTYMLVSRSHTLLLARRGSGLMQYIEFFPLQRILQSNQIAERAIRHEIKWRPSKN